MEALEKKKPNGSEELALMPYQPDTMLTVIERLLVTPDFDVNKLQHLLELREKYEAMEAKKAYVAAKARFASMDITVSKDKTNNQYNSKYTSLGNLVNTVRPYLAMCGLEPRWEIDQSNGIKITCILTHNMGHSERAVMVVPPDISGAKNPVQQIKSSITYARNLTFESVCGLASTDGVVNKDDDGNGAGAPAGLSDERYVELMDTIEGSNTLDELKTCYFAANKEAAEVKDQKAQGEFSKAKNKRYTELRNVPR
jgi:hypothetical protein